jgi:hypothetical protein
MNFVWAFEAGTCAGVIPIVSNHSAARCQAHPGLWPCTVPCALNLLA